MIFVKIFFVVLIVCFADCHNFSDVLDSSRERLLDFVSETVKNWNRVNSNTNDVVIFNIGSNDDDALGITQRISGDNSIVFPKQGQILKAGKPSFIIILSEAFGKV